MADGLGGQGNQGDPGAQGGGQVDNWLLTMPEDLQNDASLQMFAGPDGVVKLARSFVETKRMVGDRIPVPQEGDTDKWNEVYNRLGRPETPDGYQFAKVELPEGLVIDNGMVAGFKTKAHELGLSAKAANELHTWYMQQLGQGHTKLLTDYDNEVKTHLETLQKTWGSNFEPNRDLAVRTFAMYATPEIKAKVEASGAGNDPAFIELFYRIGKEMSEDVLRGGVSQAQKSKLDRIEEIMRDPAYVDDSNLEARQKRQVLIAEMERLNKEVYGENPITGL